MKSTPNPALALRWLLALHVTTTMAACDSSAGTDEIDAGAMEEHKAQDSGTGGGDADSGDGVADTGGRDAGAGDGDGGDDGGRDADLGMPTSDGGSGDRGDAGRTELESTKLLASDIGLQYYFGASVSVSGDEVVVGAWGDSDNGVSAGSTGGVLPIHH